MLFLTSYINLIKPVFSHINSDWLFSSTNHCTRRERNNEIYSRLEAGEYHKKLNFVCMLALL